ncbi:MAG TPA: DUF5010 domain-containing protein, partial [Polyangiaceae bacterium]
EDPIPGGGNLGGSAGSGEVIGPLPVDTEFTLKPEFDGPCEKRNSVDVNWGNAPEQFVRAAQCQISGTEPDAATVTELSAQLRTQSHVRRVDVVRTLCMRAGKTCTLSYQDPWQQQVELSAACARKGTRDLGAVLMYWSQCGPSNGVNCGMDWANTHSPGMNRPHQLLAFGAEPDGYYNPANPGFWRRELLDARWAGLQFLLLNTFGPDMGALPAAVQALDSIGGGIQVALFDDTWGWGKGGQPWSQLPSFDDTEGAVQLIYQKWQAFYRAIPSQHWYRYGGKPLIAFYNAGTLQPANKSAATLARLKQLFLAEFGEEPFLAVDSAFFQDTSTPNVADAQFRWNTFSNNEMSLSNMRGVSFAHFMSKWDSLNRDHAGQIATASDQIIKGPELLERYLADSATAHLALIATWNDLGEGTGVARNYDYYYQGAWLPPHAFMGRIRAAQCQ